MIADPETGRDDDPMTDGQASGSAPDAADPATVSLPLTATLTAPTTIDAPEPAQATTAE